MAVKGIPKLLVTLVTAVAFLAVGSAAASAQGYGAPTVVEGVQVTASSSGNSMVMTVVLPDEYEPGTMVTIVGDDGVSVVVEVPENKIITVEVSANFGGNAVVHGSDADGNAISSHSTIATSGSATGNTTSTTSATGSTGTGTGNAGNTGNTASTSAAGNTSGAAGTTTSVSSNAAASSTNADAALPSGAASASTTTGAASNDASAAGSETGAQSTGTTASSAAAPLAVTGSNAGLPVIIAVSLVGLGAAMLLLRSREIQSS